MKKRLPSTTSTLLCLALTAAFLPAAAHAQLKITEAESDELGSGREDWFELSNFGSSPVNVTGYKMDDSSASFGSSVAMSGVASIGPGESVVFFEVKGSTVLTAQGFRDWWGLGPSVQVGTYSGSGVGLSASGDGITVFNSTGTLVDLVTFGATTSGVTFGWNPVSQTFGNPSQAGVFGAYTAPQDGDIGSPGQVPEPTSLALTSLGALTLLGSRIRRGTR